MANKKYKLTDGNYWATDGIHDFGQNKTQREINAALVQADSDLSGAINAVATRATVTAPTLTDSWLGTANDGEYQITGGSLSGTFIDGADNAYGVLTIGRSNTYGYIFYHTNTALYRRRFGRNGTTINWGSALERIATATDLASKQNVLTFDTTPTYGSSNPVTSGGVYGAIMSSVGSAPISIGEQGSGYFTIAANNVVKKNGTVIGLLVLKVEREWSAKNNNSPVIFGDGWKPSSYQMFPAVITSDIWQNTGEATNIAYINALGGMILNWNTAIPANKYIKINLNYVT